MLHESTKLNTSWIPPTLEVVVFIVSILIKYIKPLTWIQFFGLLANLEGTVFLASAFDPLIPPHGNGGWWDSLKWAIKEFPKYGSPPSFDFIRFYFGLILLLLGIVISFIAI